MERSAGYAKKLMSEKEISEKALLRFGKRSFSDPPFSGDPKLAYALAVALTAVALKIEDYENDKWEACCLADLWADRAGRRDDVKKYYEKYEKHDDKPLINNYYANLLVDLGRYEEAEKQYKKSIKILKDEVIKIAVPYYNYASLLEKLDRRDEAEECYKKAIEVDAEYKYAHLKYANYLKNEGRKEEAEKNYKKGVKNLSEIR